MGNRLLTYVDAIKEAIEQEMKRDNRVFVIGLGVDDFKGAMGSTKGLIDTFGPDRIIDTPLSEDGMTGVVIGCALAGLRPIHVHIRMDFLLLAMNQLINIAAKSSYMYGGSYSIPIVVRSLIGRSWGQGAQHSQALHSFFMHTPGLKVVAPATPYDAKGCLIQSIRDNNPVMFIEHRMLFSQKSVVPQNLYTVDFGKARILSIGQDITIVGVSYMAVECLRAQKFLQEATVAAEVIDPVSLVPLDIDTILKSVKKSGKLLVVDTGWTSCGASAEIIARVCEKLGSLKDIQVQRIGFAPTPCPTTKNLENLFYPNAQKIAIAAYKMVGKKGGLKFQKDFEAPEIIQFKGPF